MPAVRTNHRFRVGIVIPVLVVAGLLPSWTSADSLTGGPRFDLSKDKVLYCVGYAHLDTQWRWDFTTTIDRYIHDTLYDNFALFDSYPEYVFNFTGSVRYEMMKEYYPVGYEILRKHIAEGRWYVSGSSVDEGDVNVPSPEAIIRQVLYGNEYFRREFGKESQDFMLPDCFGFPASMPSIWAHCGLRGFSTQKLTWGSAVGIPFKVGMWEGPDGRSIIAAFDPGPYAGAVQGRLDRHPDWARRIEENGTKYGVWADYHYYGVGDQGGAPKAEDVANYLSCIDNEDSLFHVALVSSDQMFKDITDEMIERLPRYKGDLLLTEHSAGTLTSQAYMKRWNRKNEILADAAERAAVAAGLVAGRPYPRKKLNRSWVRLLANQMHDILPGTSIPRAYTFSWNDEIVAANGFEAVLTDGVGAVAGQLDTDTEGRPLVVYNPLAIQREDVVAARMRLDVDDTKSVVVHGPDGRPVPTQVVSREGAAVNLIFLARVEPMSFSVFDVRVTDDPTEATGNLQVSASTLENGSYKVTVDQNGDVASIVDKRNGGREMLASPARLVFTHEKPKHWPAWNMDWKDRRKPPIDYVSGPARISIVERGPVRVTLEVEREGRNSVFAQRISLSAGEAGRRVQFDNEVDWQTASCALKASFPLTVSHPYATYNWSMGTIERGNNDPAKYEVPAHEWFDLTDPEEGYGVTVLEDCKFGSDKPSDNEVRLTLLYSPGVRKSYMDQHSQDWGRHDFTYALYGHAGDWREGQSEWQGRRVNQPLQAFEVPKQDGRLGRAWSLGGTTSPQVDIRAVKLAERDDDVVIVRVQELFGRAAEGVRVMLGAEIAEAWEVDGQERRIGDATASGQALTFDLTPYAPKSFAVRLVKSAEAGASGDMAGDGAGGGAGVPVKLLFNADVITFDADRSDGGFDEDGRTYPAEMLPEVVESEGVAFKLGPKDDGRPNAVVCRGQSIALPDEPGDVYLLAAATEDTSGEFRVGERAATLSVQGWTGFVGQWDDRVWDREFGEVDYQCDGKVTAIKTGYIKKDPIAWFATHRHHPSRGNEAYRFSYLFKYRLERPGGANTLTLPDNPAIHILAVTVAPTDRRMAAPVAPLFDDFEGREPIEFRHVYPPPPTPVFVEVTPKGQVTVERVESFAGLSMKGPSNEDSIDASRGTGAVFRYFDNDDEDFVPHGGSGIVDGTFPRLNDGLVAANDDDTSRSVWYDNAGRFYVDLGGVREVESVRAYSWHRAERAPQFFSLWGAGDGPMPAPDFKHGEHGDWTLLGVVDSRELGQGGVHGSDVTGATGGALGRYRYLLWAVEDMGNGTFFTEIDVDSK